MDITIAGVPEHFNEPWLLAIEEHNQAIGRDVDLNWRPAPGGTGQMREWLETNEVHAAIMLFEGAVQAINQGLPARIISEYVSSPLIWGIHVGASATIEKPDEIRRFPLIISRKGSGSHLIPFVMADQKEWQQYHPRLVEVNNIDGALKALRDDPNQVFFWEKFTTQPYVNDGLLRRIGTFPTPWPAFVIVVRSEYTHADAMQFAINFMARVEHYTDLIGLKTAHIVEPMGAKYGLDAREIEQWIARTRWFGGKDLVSQVASVQHALLKLNLIEEELDPEEYITM